MKVMTSLTSTISIYSISDANYLRGATYIHLIFYGKKRTYLIMYKKDLAATSKV